MLWHALTCSDMLWHAWSEPGKLEIIMWHSLTKKVFPDEIPVLKTRKHRKVRSKGKAADTLNWKDLILEMKEWTLEWIRWNMEHRHAKGLRILTTWTHKKQRVEVSDMLITELLQLQKEDCLKAIVELWKSLQWIQKSTSHPWWFRLWLKLLTTNEASP